MTLVERLFAIRSMSPFDRLTDEEIALIAEAALERKYEPGRKVASSGKSMKALFITVKGSLVDSKGRRLPAVFSPSALISGRTLTADVLASSEEGAVCLLLNKGYFFTVLYECPALAVGFIEKAGGGKPRGDSGKI